MAARAELSEAIRDHVQPGDRIHLTLGQHRWTALARELARQYWGRSPGFELVMSSLGSLSALFFRGGLVRRVVTAYSGDSFPTYSPNPIFNNAYSDGTVAVEDWSFLSLAARLEAAARGLPAIGTRSIGGSSMAANVGYFEVDTEAGRVGMVTPLAPDVALLHAPLADERGNVALASPSLEGVWGALAARRGAVVSVERIVADVAPWQHLVRIPAHRVLAVVEVPYGAHPGGVYAPGLPVTSYGEDVDFWIACRQAARADFDDWANRWCLEVADQEEYLRRLGSQRLTGLEWRDSAPPTPTFPPAPVPPTPTPWERAAVGAGREIAAAAEGRKLTVLAGAGIANLAAWLGRDLAERDGGRIALAAEIGVWDYRPQPGSPFIFNHANFPSAAMASDQAAVLGALLASAGSPNLAVLGAAQINRAGDINSTLIGSRRLVGSGGGNDVASTADRCVVVSLLQPQRTPAQLSYVTSPGRTVDTLVTDVGVLRKVDGELTLTEVFEDGRSLPQRVADAVERCGWPLRVARSMTSVPRCTEDEVAVLRRYDPARWFLD